MEIVRCRDYEEMSSKAADIVCEEIGKRPDLVLGLATGSTPLGLYREFIDRNGKGTVSFKKIKTVNLDEYVGFGESDEQSYAYFMRSNLFSHIDIDPGNTHIPDGKNADHERECSNYDAVIDELGGVDVQILGIGHDGHIGFNEPGNAFVPRTHRVKLTEETIEANKRFFERRDDVPKYAYTMGIKDIFNARKMVLLVSGKDKAEILRKALKGPITPEVPASILQLHSNLILIGEDKALELLDE